MHECTRCHHDSHSGRMCGQYNTVTVRDDVGFFAPPSGLERTFIESVCHCIVLGFTHA